MIDRAKLERCLKLRTEADKAEERLKTLIPRISARIGSYHTKSVYGRPTEELATERVTLEELLTIIRNEKGRIEAPQGGHDDMMMGLAIAHQIREQVVFTNEPIEVSPQYGFNIQRMSEAQYDYGESMVII